ncbi:hypothetical protein SVAN01_01066 [Stagonosporopsis vannaccii]|nr:hypothetical protein SVAN01_01066 [Stagonosporopsis vannaccii]
MYEVRLARCKARADKWAVYWRSKSDTGEHEKMLQRTRQDIETLQVSIRDEIRRAITDKKEQKAWRRMTKTLSMGQFRSPKSDEKTVDFSHSVGFVLFKKNVIDGWLTRLESAIETIEKLSENVFSKKTIDHFGSNPTRAQIQETKELEGFVQDLCQLAQRLHDETAAATFERASNMYGWALGLRPPTISVEHWKYMAKVPIEIRFSALQPAGDVKHLQLDVTFHKDDDKTHLSSEQIRDIVEAGASPDTTTSAGTTTAKLSFSPPQAKRTRPMGDLLKYSPKLFLDAAWYRDRAKMISAISHWALLLWDTNWMKQLCCHGLRFEKGMDERKSIDQLFYVDECPEHGVCHHSSRLRNLGLVLAQLVLGKPLRQAATEDHKNYHQWIGDSWQPIFRSDVIAEVFSTTTSIPLSDAVGFCLKDESALENERFQPGFLLECIQQIYKP